MLSGYDMFLHVEDHSTEGLPEALSETFILLEEQDRYIYIQFYDIEEVTYVSLKLDNSNAESIVIRLFDIQYELLVSRRTFS